MLGNDTAQVFATLGMRTVEDLLAADAADVARRLAHPAVTPDAVRLWQYHTSLMCFVPGVSLVDAQVLAACEVISPEALFTIDARLLADAISRFFTTERGRRFASSRERFTLERLALLQKHARRQRDRWQLLSPRYCVGRATCSAAAIRKPQPESSSPNARAVAAAADSPPKPRLARRTKERPLRFLLDRSSPVADAPSIGRLTAERLGQVGVRTVADLLNANPESTAEELGVAPRHGGDDRPLAEPGPSGVSHPGAARLRGPTAGGLRLHRAGANRRRERRRAAWARCERCAARRKGSACSAAAKSPTAGRVAGWIRHASHTRPLEAA